MMKNLGEMYDDLPKYLEVESNNAKSEIFRLVIIKNEWDGHDDACIVRYAKEGKISFSKKKFVLQTKGQGITEAMSAMYDIYISLKDKYIIGKTFFLKEYEYECRQRVTDIDDE